MKYKITDGITQSLLSAFASCRVQILNTLELWETLGFRLPLTLGSITHGTLEDYANAIIKGADVSSSDVTDKIVKNAITTRVKKELPEISSVAATEELTQAADMMQSVLQVYTQYWKKDHKRKWFAMEDVFDIMWLPPSKALGPYRLRGKIDGAFCKGKKDAWLQETKTAGQIREEELTDALSFDFQSLFYLAAMKVKYPQFSWKGVEYNVIRKPQLKAKKGENRKAFLERIWDDVNERPDFYFNRFELVFPEEVQDEFAEQLLGKLSEFEAWLNGDLVTYRNESACRGRWSCNFLKACAAGGPSKPDYKQTRVLFSELLEEGETSGSKKSKAKRRSIKKRKVKKGKAKKR